MEFPRLGSYPAKCTSRSRGDSRLPMHWICHIMYWTSDASWVATVGYLPTSVTAPIDPSFCRCRWRNSLIDFWLFEFPPYGNMWTFWNKASGAYKGGTWGLRSIWFYGFKFLMLSASTWTFGSMPYRPFYSLSYISTVAKVTVVTVGDKLGSFDTQRTRKTTGQRTIYTELWVDLT